MSVKLRHRAAQITSHFIKGPTYFINFENNIILIRKMAYFDYKSKHSPTTLETGASIQSFTQSDHRQSMTYINTKQVLQYKNSNHPLQTSVDRKYQPNLQIWKYYCLKKKLVQNNNMQINTAASTNILQIFLFKNQGNCSSLCFLNIDNVCFFDSTKEKDKRKGGESPITISK